MMTIPKFLKQGSDSGAEIETEIARLVPRHRPEKLPEPVNYAPAVEPRTAGQLSAQAMENEFQRTAKDIENLGVELIDLAKKCEGAMAYLQKTIQHLNDTADYYRVEAKRIYGEIEAYAGLAEDVRRQSELMRQRLAKGEPSRTVEAEVEKGDEAPE
jgi:hypothetical protein